MKEFKRLRKILNQGIKKMLPDNLLVYRGNRKSNKVAITFDDGPYLDNTYKILKILEKHNVKASFFMNGRAIEQHRKAFCKVIEAGHEIDNHLYNHRPVSTLTYKELHREVIQWENSVQGIISLNNLPRFLRPPDGRVDLKTLWYAWKNSKTIVLWSVDTCDLDGLSFEDNIKMLESKFLSSGDIILLHEDAKYIDGLLEWIIEKAKSQGLEFCKVSDLLKKV
ncbi:MAG: polysaccharide deacetylase family protein [Nitrospirota bacterium]